MPLVLTAAPDYPEIRRLIKAHGWTMTRFARMLGRAPKSVYNIKYKDVISTAFICQIATALGVKPSQISDMEDDPEEAPVSEAERKMAS
jgi:transcriptional regulator with XRE-family HTH domain